MKVFKYLEAKKQLSFFSSIHLSHCENISDNKDSGVLKSSPSLLTQTSSEKLILQRKEKLLKLISNQPLLQAAVLSFNILPSKGVQYFHSKNDNRPSFFFTTGGRTLWLARCPPRDTLEQQESTLSLFFTAFASPHADCGAGQGKNLTV